MADELRYDGKVAIVTGAGAGLGRAHALLLASRGAKVVVNDLGGDIHGGGASQMSADKIVDEIKAAGGEATANYDSVENGEKIVKTAIDAYGKIDIVINNAGILRDVSFAKMTDQDWDIIFLVHMKGTYSVTKAAWPYMREQNYGRIVNTASAAGIYGNFGQANYSAAKLGILGFTNTLAIEGANRNIHANVIAPIAGSRLTETVMPKEVVEALKPEFVSPLVAYLCHEDTEENGGLFELGAGWMGKLRWQRTKGHGFHPKKELTPDDVAQQWDKITNWDGADNPADIRMSMAPAMQNMNRPEPKGGNENIDVDAALGFEFKPVTTSYNKRDVCLYALGVGAAKDATDPKELQFVYENSGSFQALPTMGVTFPFSTLAQLGAVPGLKFNPMMLLHGEQYLELKRPIPTEGEITSSGKVKHVYDKGKGVVIVMEATSSDKDGNEIAVNEFSIFIRGIGGWGGDRGPSGDINVPPDRAPDAVHEDPTSEDQALLYRLSGDTNPLHADPNMAKLGNFDRPILHGLCTFGHAGRAILKHFCDNDPKRFKSIKVRFARHVFPGETIVTEMWKEGDKVIFQTKVKERDEVVLSNSVVELQEPAAAEASGGNGQAAAAAAPHTNGTQKEIVELFAQMKDRVEGNTELLEKVGAVYRFEITGGTNKAWTVNLKEGPASVVEGEEGKADCTITITDDDFLAMNKGTLDPQQAFMQGKLKIGGNMMLAQKLGDIMK